MSRPLAYIVFVLLLLTPSLAQEIYPTPVLIPDLTSAATPASPAVEPEFSSPRASLERFEKVMSEASPMRPGLYLLGPKHLNLSEIPAVVREERGIALAQQLHDILGTLDLTSVSLEAPPEVDEVALYREPSGKDIVLRKQPDGRWLFSAATVRLIPEIYQAMDASTTRLTTGTPLLERSFLGVKGRVWTLLLILPLFSYLFGCLVVWILRASLGRLLTVRFSVPEVEQKAISRPIGWLAASLVTWVGLCLIAIPSGLFLVLIGLIKVTATMSAITVAFRMSDAASQYAKTRSQRTASTFDDMLVPLARRSFKVVVGTLGVLFLAQNLDIEVWSLFAGFSVFGAMVALAGQDTVKNFFGSLTVLGDRPFGVGDWVVVEGIEGVVEDVGFRSTRIRTFYDSLITLPNSRLITASVDNYGRRNFRRYTKKLAVRWNTPPKALEAFCEGIREIVRQHPYTRKDSYQVWVNDVNDYALEILIYIFFAAPDWGTELRERHRFLLDVHCLAMDLGIELAYPSQQLFMGQHEERAQLDFDQLWQESGMEAGRSSSKAILQRTLPRETPPPLLLDERGHWITPSGRN